MTRVLAEELIATLPAGLSGLFNPWRDACPFDTDENGPEARISRLVRHLECDARLVLVGEAPGYQGCRYSGIAFTSERLLLEGAIPRIEPIAHRLSVRKLPFSEPSATIVWKTLYRLGVANDTLLWNAVQLHPFRAGEPWSNRTPTDAELAHGVDALKLLANAFPKAKIVAVGQKAAGVLGMLGVPFHAAVRHPANGGATAFSEGLAAAVKTK
ncbi:MAG: uracil-DNA glycosylase [Propionivibrio sp.]|nr:uracil-DNA glycosylase [Propionivibrio sp.]